MVALHPLSRVLYFPTPLNHNLESQPSGSKLAESPSLGFEIPDASRVYVVPYVRPTLQ
jgi:hypothetical protein